MAEESSAAGFLTQKVGPLPIWAYAAIAIVVFLYVQKKGFLGIGGSGTPSSGSATTPPNQQTDPAGNVGSIDPATGYVYGSPEDTAALASNNAGSTGSAGDTGTSGAQTYADNNTWAVAAVSYLDGIGIDPTTASQAIQLYLNSQSLTPSQQGDVNLAISKLGPPPTLPGPVTGNPPPVTTPNPTKHQVIVPDVKGKTTQVAVAEITKAGLKAGAHSTEKGTVNGQTPGAGTKVDSGSTVDLSVGASAGGSKSVPAPTGLAVGANHSTSVVLKWNKAQGAKAYHVTVTDMASKKVVFTGDTSGLTIRANGLTPSHSYVADVWGLSQPGASENGPHATVSWKSARTG